jgi:hypothetical protein
MGYLRRPTVALEGDLLLGRRRLKKVDAAFLEAYCQHFQEVGTASFKKRCTSSEQR